MLAGRAEGTGTSVDKYSGDAAAYEEPLIQLNGLHKWYGDQHVLRGINLTVSRGEVVALIGSSGSGKSTLLRCVNLLERPTYGRVLFRGIDLTDVRTDVNVARQSLGIVFQSFNLFPHLTVTANITLALKRVLKLSDSEAHERASRELAKVGLSDKADAYPGRLSGGQQQRVAIARALAMEPAALLLDEVTSALDPELIGEVLAVLRDLAHGSMTMMVVTHEINFARDVSSRVLFLSAGVVAVDGPPHDLLDNPTDARLKRFLKGN